MKTSIFFGLLSLSFSISAATCLKEEKGAHKIHEQGYGASKTAKLETTKLQSSKGDLFRVHDPQTCGVRGCEFVLAHADAKGCLTLSFVGYGSIKPAKAGDYSVFLQTTKVLPVDNGGTTKLEYALNSAAIYEETPKK